MHDAIAKKLREKKFAYADLNGAALSEFEARIARAARSDSEPFLTYGDLVKNVPLRTPRREFHIEGPGFAPFYRRFIASLLGELSKRTYLRGRFFASALVVNKQTARPSETFFRWLEDLGVLTSADLQAKQRFLSEQRLRAREWYEQQQPDKQSALISTLLEQGALASLPSSSITSEEFRKWRPVQVSGPPISQTLIEERR